MGKRLEGNALEGFQDIRVVNYGLKDYLSLIRSSNYFAFVKRAHGFWDRLVDSLERDRGKIAEDMEEKSHYKHFWSPGFLDDLLQDLKTPPSHGLFFEAISFRGYSRGGLHEKILDSRHPKEKLHQAVQTYCPNQRIWHNALVLKDWVFSGELLSLFESIKNLDIILVGPPHLRRLGEFLDCKKLNHILIHPTEAIKDRHKILSEILQVNSLSSGPRVVLFQAGSLAYWLIFRLFGKLPNAYFLDMGRVLDIWSPDIVIKQPWFMKNKELIIKNMKLENLYK